MSEYLLGIDYGTGGAKACIINGEADVLSYAYREYPIIVQKPGWSEHDPKLYWEIACEIIKECIIKAGVDPKEIKGIGTSAALPCLVMVDSKNENINMAYNLMDKRAKEEVNWLINNIGEDRIFNLTGNRLEDHPSIVNLLWEKQNRPEAFKKIFKALTIDGYIRLKLTGKYTVNYSNATFLGAYNIRKNEFDIKLLQEIGIDKNIMPDVFCCEDIIGEVTPKAARETGLKVGIAVAAGQADFNAGCIGGGIIQEGEINMNLGTCGNFGIIHKDANFMKSMLACAFTVKSDSTYVTIPTTTTGGQAIRYLRDNFSQVEIGMEKLIGKSVYSFLDMEAESVGIGSEGLVILPYLMGERTPLWDADARGVIFGLSLNHSKAHIVRAMMESVAYALYDSFCIIKEAGKKLEYPIVLNEGGARSNIWRRIITDVFNAPTVVVKSRVGAPLGDAILAGVSTGVFKDYSISKQKTQYIDRMEPVQKNHEMYMEYFSIFKKLYAHLKDDFKELAVIRKKYY
jgi:ribulokinase